MKIERDLKRIEALAVTREDENWEFRRYLKQLDIDLDDLDDLVRRLTADVSAQIDCTQCANCCKLISPILDQADVVEFAAGLRATDPEASPATWQEIYLRPVEGGGPDRYQFKALPCPFLEADRCSNYAARPTECRDYPYLHKDGFRSRLWGVVSNYALCPIVFNVYERLKAEFGFRMK